MACAPPTVRFQHARRSSAPRLQPAHCSLALTSETDGHTRGSAQNMQSSANESSPVHKKHDGNRERRDLASHGLRRFFDAPRTRRRIAPRPCEPTPDPGAPSDSSPSHERRALGSLSWVAGLGWRSPMPTVSRAAFLPSGMPLPVHTPRRPMRPFRRRRGLRLH